MGVGRIERVSQVEKKGWGDGGYLAFIWFEIPQAYICHLSRSCNNCRKAHFHALSFAAERHPSWMSIRTGIFHQHHQIHLNFRVRDYLRVRITISRED